MGCVWASYGLCGHPPGFSKTIVFFFSGIARTEPYLGFSKTMVSLKTHIAWGFTKSHSSLGMELPDFIPHNSLRF